MNILVTGAKGMVGTALCRKTDGNVFMDAGIDRIPTGPGGG